MMRAGDEARLKPPIVADGFCRERNRWKLNVP
jgi:hypothetical protein